MRSIRLMLSIVLGLGLISSCTRPIDPAAQKEARAGLDAAVAQIPKIAGFTTVKIVYREFYDYEYDEGPVCYYARAFLIIGSSLPGPQAPDTYAEELQIAGLGWKAQDEPFSLTTMSRGTNERAAVSLAEPDVVVHDAVDYTQLRKKYSSIIFLQLDYILPDEKSC